MSQSSPSIAAGGTCPGCGARLRQPPSMPGGGFCQWACRQAAVDEAAGGRAAGGPKVSEAELQRAVIQCAEALGCLVYHVSDVRGGLRASTSVGFPDLVVCGSHGTSFRELKAEAGRLSPEQSEWLRRLHRAGQDALVWRPRHWLAGAVERDLRQLAGRGP